MGRIERGRINFFNADYRDGIVFIGGKRYSAGTFCVALLNDYNLVFSSEMIPSHYDAIRKVSNELDAGRLVGADLMKAGEEILQIINLVKHLQPFDSLDDEWEKADVADMFTEDTVEMITEYFRRQSPAGNTDLKPAPNSVNPPGYNSSFYSYASAVLAQLQEILYFYITLEADISFSFRALTDFTDSISNLKRFDEAHLLPIAMKALKPLPEEVRIEYVSRKKSSRSSTVTVARRMYFRDYESFITADFFEGLHCGHYPRKCGICGRYFLVTTARNTRYCTGYANELYRGKKITCRNLAAKRKKKEQPEDNPVIIRYTKRCSVIRAEKGRGTITEDFAAAAKALAKDHKQLALTDPDYANGQYIRDMEHDKLYEDTRRRLDEGPGS